MDSQKDLIQEKADKYRDLARSLLSKEITMEMVNVYARKQFPTEITFFPRRQGSDTKIDTDKVAKEIGDMAFFEVFQLLLAFNSQMQTSAASPSAVVKQALAHNRDIEIRSNLVGVLPGQGKKEKDSEEKPTEGKKEKRSSEVEGLEKAKELEKQKIAEISPESTLINGNPIVDDTVQLTQYRGVRMHSVPSDMLLVVDDADEGKNFIPCYRGAVNTNYVRVSEGDKVTGFTQVIADVSLICTHLFQWKRGIFRLKDGWTDAEFTRFGLDSVFKKNRKIALAALQSKLGEVVAGSSMKADFKSQVIQGPLLQERLETMLTESANKKRCVETIMIVNQMFREYKNPLTNKTNTVIRSSFIEDADKTPRTLLLYNFPKQFRQSTMITKIENVVFKFEDQSATWKQANSELKSTRIKCGTNVNNETTPGTHEWNIGVRTGTDIVNYFNLASDLSKVDYIKHPKWCLIAKRKKHVQLYLKSIGQATTDKITVTIPGNLYDSLLIEEGTYGKRIKAAPNVSIDTYIDVLEVKKDDTCFLEYLSKDDDSNGNKTTIAEQGANTLAAIKRKDYKIMTRLANFPGLLNDTDVTVFSGAAMHNMVNWVAKGISFKEGAFEDRYSGADSENNYYYAVVMVNYLRAINPFWQENIAKVLARFQVKVPKIQMKIKGEEYMAMDYMDGDDRFDDASDFTLYTNVAHRSAIMERRSEAMRDGAAAAAAMQDEEGGGGTGDSNDSETTMQTIFAGIDVFGDEGEDDDLNKYRQS